MTIEFADRLTELLEDPRAAGIRRITHYDSPSVTVTPPAGTLHAGDRDIDGEFALPDGRLAATIDSWGSQASRMETATEAVAERIGYPLIRFVAEDGELLTTSARLSHRHADATWRIARKELEVAGVPFEDVQNATVRHADPLLRWYPLAIPFGWWHSHTMTTDAKKANEKEKDRLKAVGSDEEIAGLLEGYAKMHADSRSARLVTSEIVASGVSRRRRMAARSDSLFGPLKGGERSDRGRSTGPSSLGLGSLPPVMLHKAPVDVTYESIDGHWFLSLAGLRQFGFDDVDPTTARTLVAAYALYIHRVAQQETRLRAGAELVASPHGSSIEVLRHDAEAEALEIPNDDELEELVRLLGEQIGWEGPVDVVIPSGSPLDRLRQKAAAEAEA